MSGESGLADADRMATDVWQLVIGTGPDPSSTTDGIIGSMFETGYAPFTGLLQADVHPFRTEPINVRPEAWIIATASGAHTEEVGSAPNIITVLTVTSTFRTQPGTLEEGLFDCEFYRQTYCDMLRDAALPGNAVYKFNIADAAGFSVYHVGQTWDLDDPAYEDGAGGYPVMGTVKHKVLVKRS